MKEFKVYTPWDSLIVEAENEKEAKRIALRELLMEIESASTSDLDAEYIGDLD